MHLLASATRLQALLPTGKLHVYNIIDDNIMMLGAPAPQTPGGSDTMGSVEGGDLLKKRFFSVFFIL
jgi:hypothetical protein